MATYDVIYPTNSVVQLLALESATKYNVSHAASNVLKGNTIGGIMATKKILFRWIGGVRCVIGGMYYTQIEA